MASRTVFSVVVMMCLAPPMSVAATEELEVAALRRRVEELEAQNREIRAELDEIKTQLRGSGSQANAAAPLVASSASPTPPSAPPGVAPEVRIGESRLGFYGFLRLDAIRDDSRTNSFQSPLFIQPEGPGAGREDAESFTLHPRLTRFGMNFAGPQVAALGQGTLSGRLEIDFQNGGRESRPISRFRHAYLETSWPRSSLLLGQTFDVISPLFPNVNADTLMWNVGNLGDRRPLVRYRCRSSTGRLSFDGAAGLTGAVDAQDLDGDEVRDGEAAAVPHLQARIGLQSREKDRWSLGVWSHLGRMETSAPVGGETRFDSSSLGFDYRFALGERLDLQGEVWTGEGLGDFRGGVGQSVNTKTGQVIASRGGWLEIGADLGASYSLFAGYTLDDPENGDVLRGGRTQNRAWYLAQRLRFGKPFLVGLEYLRWTTEYQSLPDGNDNRFNLFVVYSY